MQISKRLSAALLGAALFCTGPAAAQQEGGLRGAAPETPAPVLNARAVAGERIVTLRRFVIRKGSFPAFLEASQTGVWPYFEKIGARVVGMWQVVGSPLERKAPAEHDEVYLMTEYASMDHWQATRRPWEMGGNGPDFDALREALAIRRDLTIETSVIMMQGATGPMGPYYLPGLAAGE